MRASEDAPTNPDEQRPLSGKELEGLGGGMAPNQLGGAQQQGGQMVPDSVIKRAPAALSPTVEGSAQKLYSPPGNRDLSSDGGLEKFFPKNEEKAHLGVWGEYGDGVPSGALGISSKGWEYGAGNPITEEPEKVDPLINTRGPVTQGSEHLRTNDWYNKGYKGEPTKKPAPGNWNKPLTPWQSFKAGWKL